MSSLIIIVELFFHAYMQLENKAKDFYKSSTLYYIYQHNNISITYYFVTISNWIWPKSVKYLKKTTQNNKNLIL